MASTQSASIQAPSSQAEHSELGHLSVFDGLTLIAAVLGACVLAYLRRRGNMKTDLDMWFSDALNIGTLMVLAGLIVTTFLPHIGWLEDTVRANAFLVVLSFIYCAAVIGNSLRKSVRAVAEVA